MSNQQVACDAACSGSGDNSREKAVRAIAEAIQNLPTEARQKLTELLNEVGN